MEITDMMDKLDMDKLQHEMYWNKEIDDIFDLDIG